MFSICHTGTCEQAVTIEMMMYSKKHVIVQTVVQYRYQQNPKLSRYKWIINALCVILWFLYCNWNSVRESEWVNTRQREWLLKKEKRKFSLQATRWDLIISVMPFSADWVRPNKRFHKMKLYFRRELARHGTAGLIFNEQTGMWCGGRL